MKIAILVHSLDRFAGGVENRVSEWEVNLPTLIQRDILIYKDIVNLPHWGNIIKIPNLKFSKYVLHNSLLKPFIGIYLYLFRVFYTRKILKKNRYDRIIAFDDYFGLIAVLSTLGLKSNIIVSIRNCIRELYSYREFVHLLPSFFYTTLYPLLLKRENILIHTVSHCLEKELKKNYNLHRIKTIYNLFDIDKVKRFSKEQIGIREHFIISVGHFNRQKNLLDLIETFNILKTRYQIQEKLLLIGDGKLRDEIEKKIKEYHLKDEVILIGRQKNPYKFLAKAKLFVSTSLFEGLPSVFIEAHILGVPVVTYSFKCGADELSLFVSSPNPNDLAILAYKVLRDKNLQNSSLIFSKKIIAKVKKDVVMKEWMEFLDV